jgi:hypothetical protein
MVIDLTNHTRAIPMFQSQQPQDALRRRGLGQAMPYGDFDFGTAVDAFNAEALWLSNVWRQAQGKPPIDPQYAAPGVNVSLSPESKNLLILLAVGIGAVALSRR